MATLVRRLLKTVLFVGLFMLSVRYVHTHPVPMAENQLMVLLSIANRVGIRDPDDLYILVMLILELLVTVVAYVMFLKLWRLLKARHRTN
jgi:hypothetical protein